MVIFVAAWELWGKLAENLRPGLPRWLQLGGATSDWTLRWDEIARVAVVERFGLLHLVKRGKLPRRYPVRLTDWKLDVPDGELDPAPSDAPLQSTPLWQALAAHGLFDKQADDPVLAPLNFDLTKHPATRAALVVLAALALYAFADAFLVREAWAGYGVRYYVPHVAVALIAGVLAALLISTMRAPGRVAPGVAAMLGLFIALAAAPASYFGLLRVNQRVGGPLEARAYVRNGACDALIPVDPGLPEIEYSELARGYWCQFAAEQRQEVLIRRGLFGLYQVDLTAHTAAIRAFRSERR